MNNERTVFLTTEHLDLVLLEPRDAAIMCAWFNNVEVTKYLSRGEFPMGMPYEEEYLEKTAKEYNYAEASELKLGVWHREDQKLIGVTGIHAINNRDQQASFGITIGEQAYWSNGHGTEVLEAMLTWSFTVRNLRMVTLRVLGNNPRGIRCYEKCGFVLAGTIPQSVFKTGEWVDEHIMYVTNKN